jgi:four helix bundle protein
VSRDHRKLRAFELADALVIGVYKVTASFPKEELFGLTSQVRRASVSVAANIVEGSARSSEKEYLQFLRLALGSLREAGYLIALSTRLGYVEADRALGLSAQYEETARVLSGLIRSLKGEL